MPPTNPPSSHLDSSSLYSNPLIALALPSAYFCKNILLPGKRPNPFHANRRWFGSIGGHNRPRQGSPSTSSMTNLHASARPIQLLPTPSRSNLAFGDACAGVSQQLARRRFVLQAHLQPHPESRRD